jgi:hypothetical protein
MLAPLLALSLGFSSPQSKLPAPALPDSKLLALRGGGISTDALYNTVIGITAAVGFQGWLAPKKTMEMYGVADMSTTESVFLRTLSSENVAAAVTLIAVKTDVEKAVLVGWIAWILACTANVPLFETINTPSGPVIATIGVFSAVAGLAATGIISMDVAGYILLAGLVPMSILETISPQAIFDSYGLPKPSPLVKSLFENFSFTKLALGACLLVTKMTGKAGLGLAALAAVNAVNCLKTLTRADEVGLAKPGLIVWTVFQSAVAAMAYLNDK